MSKKGPGHLPSPSEIAKCALDFYNSPIYFPSNRGKPQPSREFTVYSAFVASRVVKKDGQEKHELWVVSCATGSKCCAAKPTDQGLVLHDSHAEVLARRGLIRVLWKEIDHELGAKGNDTDDGVAVLSKVAADSVRNNDSNDIDEHKRLLEFIKPISPNELPGFRLRQGVALHMYISDSPCGDASIYELNDVNKNLKSSCNTCFTGAKIIVLDQSLSTSASLQSTESLSKGVSIARENKQILGALRLKSGRSNIPAHLRSMSHSCSDKMCRWLAFGLQGSLLSMWIREPITLTSVCVSRDKRSLHSDNHSGSQFIALKRALYDRSKQAIVAADAIIASARKARIKDDALRWSKNLSKTTPRFHIVDEIFPFSKSETEYKNSLVRSKDHLNNDKIHNEEPEKKRLKSSHKKKIVAAGTSLNWQQNCSNIEVTVGASGIVHGKKPKNDDERKRMSSRLCRRNILRLATKYVKLLVEIESNRIDSEKSFRNEDELKKTFNSRDIKTMLSPNYIQLFRDTLLTCDPLRGWISTTSETDNFCVKLI